MDRPTETPNDPINDGEPESVARSFGANEWVKHLGLHFPRHPAAGV